MNASWGYKNVPAFGVTLHERLSLLNSPFFRGTSFSSNFVLRNATWGNNWSCSFKLLSSCYQAQKMFIHYTMRVLKPNTLVQKWLAPKQVGTTKIILIWIWFLGPLKFLVFREKKVYLIIYFQDQSLRFGWYVKLQNGLTCRENKKTDLL